MGRLLLAVAVVLPACTVTFESGGDDGPSPLPTSGTPSPGSTETPLSSSVVGSGNVKTESRSVAGFTSVRFRGSGELIVEQTGVESLTIQADDNILPLLRSDVENGQLILALRPGSGIVTRSPIIYRLTVKQLNGINASGSGSTEVKDLDTDRFALDGSGSIEVKLAGRVDELEVTLSGSGDLSSESLTAKKVSVVVSGSADVVVNAEESLDVKVSGSGDVKYTGNPRSVSQAVSGSGDVGPK